MARRDWFSEAFGAPATDIRQKLVEEAWFGRTVTPRPLASLDRGAEDRSMAEGLGWDQPDRVLREKLDPDRSADKAFLQWLEGEHADRTAAPMPDKGIDR